VASSWSELNGNPPSPGSFGDARKNGVIIAGADSHTQFLFLFISRLPVAIRSIPAEKIHMK